VLISVKGALYESIGMWLPEKLRGPVRPNTARASRYPRTTPAPVPEGYGLLDLAPCKYLVFQGEPFEDERFEEAITASGRRSTASIPPLRLGMGVGGWPRFQLETRGDRGYIEARP
jgi:hypothetical protein